MSEQGEGRMTKRHSFISQGWGHALHIKTVEPGVLKGLMHSRERINVGDELEWRVALGRNIGKVTECRWVGDPEDMFDVTVVVTERIPEEAK